MSPHRQYSNRLSIVRLTLSLRNTQFGTLGLEPGCPTLNPPHQDVSTFLILQLLVHLHTQDNQYTLYLLQLRGNLLCLLSMFVFTVFWCMTQHGSQLIPVYTAGLQVWSSPPLKQPNLGLLFQAWQPVGQTHFVPAQHGTA